MRKYKVQRDISNFKRVREGEIGVYSVSYWVGVGGRKTLPLAPQQLSFAQY